MPPHRKEKPASFRLLAAFGPGLGGLVALAVAGSWMAWQAGRVNAIEVDAPLPRVPASPLMTNIASRTEAEPGRSARIAAPTPTPKSDPEWWAPAPGIEEGVRGPSDRAGREPELPGGG